MKCNIDLGPVRNYLIWECVCQCVSLSEWVSVCVHAYLFLYSVHMPQIRMGTWITQWSWSSLIIQNTLISRLSTGMCIPADIITRCLVFCLGNRETCLWAQLQQWRKLNERGWFMHTMARHLHEIPINLSGRHLGPGTNFIWDCQSHSIHSGGRNLKESGLK